MVVYILIVYLDLKYCENNMLVKVIPFQTIHHTSKPRHCVGKIINIKAEEIYQSYKGDIINVIIEIYLQQTVMVFEHNNHFHEEKAKRIKRLVDSGVYTKELFDCFVNTFLEVNLDPCKEYHRIRLEYIK